MSQALYRKYRSKSLDEVVGQDHITSILKNALANNKIAHAYLLTGPRGVGKTSIARILAHEINHLPYQDESTHLDIIEIDAASNTSVEDVRDLREKARIAPVSAEKKIYIVDEVHMLSKSAFNALLKILEEPPEHVIFILATTDAEKLPDTILSRVQRFNFRSVSQNDVINHLKTIANLESIKIDDEALKLVADHGNGSFRDSISLLDQLQNLSSDNIKRDDVESILGLTPADKIERLLNAYETNDIATIVEIIDENEANGASAVGLANQLIKHLRSKIIENPALVKLLDNLTEVGRSSWPHVKLLSALSSNQTVFNKPVQKEKPITKPQATTVPSEKEEEKLEEIEKAKPDTKKSPAKGNTEFNWKDFIEAVKIESTAVYSLLAKCDYDLSDNTLTIYAGKSFTKKRLEAPKYQVSINKALENLEHNEVEITIDDGNKPPKDSQAAKIVAMMGGGQEVKLNDKI